MLKKSLAVATMSIACAFAFAPMAQAADAVPDFEDDIEGSSISEARATIKDTGNLMLIKLDSTVLECDAEDREATAMRSVYFAPIDRSNVTVTFSCPEEE